MRIGSVRDLGLVVRDARRQRGLSQHELADLVGVSRQWVALVESGRGNPGLTPVLEVLHVLERDLVVERQEDDGEGSDLDRLLGRTHAPWGLDGPGGG